MYRALVVAACCAAGVARADSMVCKSKIVETGISGTDLRRTCGEPTVKRSKQIDVLGPTARGTSKTGEATIETWRYERGNRKSAAVVTLRDGKVVSIKYE